MSQKKVSFKISGLHITDCASSPPLQEASVAVIVVEEVREAWAGTRTRCRSTTRARWRPRHGTTPSTPCRAAPAQAPASRNKEEEVVTPSDTTRTSRTSSTTMTATEASCNGGELAQSVIWRPEILKEIFFLGHPVEVR